MRISTRSGPDGRFEVNGLWEGEYILSAKGEGYSWIEERVSIGEGSVWDYELELSKLENIHCFTNYIQAQAIIDFQVDGDGKIIMPSTSSDQRKEGRMKIPMDSGENDVWPTDQLHESPDLPARDRKGAGGRRPAFGELRNVPEAIAHSAIRLADFNADGVPDAISSGPEGTIILYGRLAAPLTARFLRGDATADQKIDLIDAIAVLEWFILAGSSIPCEDAADANDDGRIDLTDAIAVLAALFIRAWPLPAPGPADCGPDPTSDALGCETKCP